MVNQQLVDYIRTEEAQGYPPEQLRNVLLKQGFPADDIDFAIAIVDQQPGVTQNTATNNPQSQQAGGIKKRNPFLIVLFSLITLGIYSIFWLVFTTNELKNNTKSAPNPLLLLAMLIPIVGIFVSLFYMWKYCKAINELTGFSNIILFLLWIFIAPVGMILSQMELNKRAE